MKPIKIVKQSHLFLHRAYMFKSGNGIHGLYPAVSFPSLSPPPAVAHTFSLSCLFLTHSPLGSHKVRFTSTAIFATQALPLLLTTWRNSLLVIPNNLVSVEYSTVQPYY